VDIICSYQNSVVSCSERIMPGTRATLACKSSYKLPLTNDPAYREITCLEDGLWDRRVFRCLPGERSCYSCLRNRDGKYAEASMNLISFAFLYLFAFKLPPKVFRLIFFSAIIVAVDNSVFPRLVIHGFA